MKVVDDLRQSWNAWPTPKHVWPKKPPADEDLPNTYWVETTMFWYDQARFWRSYARASLGVAGLATMILVVITLFGR